MKLPKFLSCLRRSKASQYRVEVFVDVLASFRWRLRHVNGNILATSEAYSSQSACLDTAENLAQATRIELVHII